VAGNDRWHEEAALMDTQKQGKSNRLVFLSIVGIPVTIVLAASWLWYFVARGDLDLVAIVGTSNNGSLVQPPRLLDGSNLAMPGEAGFADLAPQWTFLVPGGATCDAGCEQLLYLTRQIHQAMGKDLSRIRRFYVSDTPVAETLFKVPLLSDKRPAPVDLREYLASEQHGLAAYTVSKENHALLFAEYSINPTTWYLVDPAGWIMMSYNSDVSYKDVMADLSFLLKNSSE